ncbi:MAG: hypothetical protein R3F11_23410 [Verrucomicrobiales bacterium]
MKPIRRPALAAAALFSVTLFARAEAPQPAAPAGEALPKASDFLRFDEGEEKSQLKLAVTRYSKDGVTVDLVSAVHLGDPAYFEALGDRFKKYDCVLFEMVGGDQLDRLEDDPDAQKEKEEALGGAAQLMKFAQGMMKNFLKLEYQLDNIDYHAENFVHADLSLEEFAAIQEETGNTFADFIGQMMQKEFARIAQAKEDGEHPGETAEINPLQLFAMLNSPDGGDRMKLMMGRQFANMNHLMEDYTKEGEGSVVIAERNKKAMEVFETELKNGKKKLAIYYGAFHMPDFAYRLGKLGFKEGETDWITAWDVAMPKGVKPKAPEEEK